tara:strand:+ start:602 stop:874 length:273 start_codon:yes stop_codon:yes gene_type:complete
MKKQLIELLGKDTILKFNLLCEGIVEYETVTPHFDGGWFVSHRIELKYKSQDVLGLHCYSSLKDLLNQMRVFSVVEIKDSTKNEKIIYRQ